MCLYLVDKTRDHLRARLCAALSQNQPGTLLIHAIHDTPGVNGGFSDRMKGVVSAFLVAIATKRSFCILHSYPTSLLAVLQPAVVDWRCPPTSHRSRTVFHMIDTEAPFETTNFSVTEEVVVIYSNMYAFKHLLRNVVLGPALQRLGLTHDHDPPAIFGCIFSLLFTCLLYTSPSPRD